MAIYQDEKLVKRAYSKVHYTKTQIDELRACMDPNTGPLYFMSNFMYVQHSTRGKEKIELYDFQIELLKTYVENRKSVNLLGRQLGKCLDGNTRVNIRNKTTGLIENLTFEEFENIIGKSNPEE